MKTKVEEVQIEARPARIIEIEDRFIFRRVGHKHNGKEVIVGMILGEEYHVCSYAKALKAKFDHSLGNGRSMKKLKTWICKAGELA